MAVKESTQTRPKFKTKLAKNICVTSEYEDSIWYTLQCDCGMIEHAVRIELEYVKDYRMVSLHFYKECEWYESWDNWWEKPKAIWRRFKKAMRLLFLNELTCQEEFLILEEDHMNDFITALIDARDFLHDAHKELEQNWKNQISTQEYIANLCKKLGHS